MSIVIGENTKLVISGLTGREGTFHGLRNREYGTDVVAGVTPKKGGQDVEGIPVFDSVKAAVSETGANTALVFVPAPFAADAMYEAIDAGIGTVVCVTEGVPAHEMLRLHAFIERRDVRLVGPNCPGVLSPGKANVGIIPAAFFSEGNVGVVSRSGTLTYEVVEALTEAGIGQSTCVGIGGDPINGSNFVDILTLFRDDPDTHAVVLIGEIGGEDEEQAAAFVMEQVRKPMAAFIAGRTAPPGRRMGHAGAIISGGAGTAASKVAALEAAGFRVAGSPTELPALLREAGYQS